MQSKGLPKKIYLAGPDVFKPDFPSIRDGLKALCLNIGLIALSPADGDPLECAPSEMSRQIYLQNIALIEDADIVMANVENFRGHEPDSGTMFEIGYAVARGKTVWCYNVPANSLVDQIPCDANRRDCDGYAVEDFALSRNLMLVHSSKQIVGDAEKCIQAIGDHYGLPDSLPSDFAQDKRTGDGNSMEIVGEMVQIGTLEDESDELGAVIKRLDGSLVTIKGLSMEETRFASASLFENYSITLALPSA